MTDIGSFSNYQIVTIAIALLGGDSEFIDREDIAIRANELAPGKFSWRKYPNRIDLDAVGVALRDAKKAKNGELVVGSNTRGWMLSPHGFRWVSTLGKSENEVSAQLKEKSSVALLSQKMERERLFRTTAYEMFVDEQEEDITQHDFFQFVRVNEYFKSKARERRYTIISNAVAGDDVLSALWVFLKERFL